ncbi:hypothetical protein PoB_005012400 [Plakobranchus ocellatus]|uniref:Uncharacterized protein n=1 Tax=Plakobranchus ocellatus TaxID=259542 RepID=A0AAV4BXS9_9GAST|nr:hypothetical protein PoB_005012400 [Plakobranchus ocellatus]
MKTAAQKRFATGQRKRKPFSPHSGECINHDGGASSPAKLLLALMERQPYWMPGSAQGRMVDSTSKLFGAESPSQPSEVLREEWSTQHLNYLNFSVQSHRVNLLKCSWKNGRLNI